MEIVADQDQAVPAGLGLSNAGRAVSKIDVVREEKDSAVRGLEEGARTIGEMTNAVTALRSSRARW